MQYLPAIFALLVGAAGWFYLFYSKAAHNLGAIEQQEFNRLRIRLRRTNGVVLLLLAACFAAAYYGTGAQRTFVMLFMAVLVLLLGSVVLALIDVRLTRKLRRQRREQRENRL
jgi:drug/metabolite transporter (DMT)-like permease